jgi:DNA-binding GntR family transcriptional regulator
MKIVKIENLKSKLEKIEFRASGLAEKMAETLSDAILEGIIKAGDQLLELELQKQFGISRTPIRESFRVLENEGLVEIIPRKGAFVKRISRRDIEEHFPVRSALEGVAAKFAYLNMTADKFKTIERIYTQMKNAAENEDTKNYLKLHNLFHDVFIENCGNQLLINLLKNLRKQISWYRLSYRYYDQDLQKSLKIHKVIIDMLKNKGTDLTQLEMVVRKHINDAAATFLSYLDELEPGKEPNSKSPA